MKTIRNVLALLLVLAIAALPAAAQSEVQSALRQNPAKRILRAVPSPEEELAFSALSVDAPEAELQAFYDQYGDGPYAPTVGNRLAALKIEQLPRDFAPRDFVNAYRYAYSNHAKIYVIRYVLNHKKNYSRKSYRWFQDLTDSRFLQMDASRRGSSDYQDYDFWRDYYDWDSERE